MEVTAQILDALAFLFVTPEFLGEQTLTAIRGYFDTVAAFVQALFCHKIFSIFVVFTFVLSFIQLFVRIYYDTPTREDLIRLFSEPGDLQKYVGFWYYAEFVWRSLFRSAMLGDTAFIVILIPIIFCGISCLMVIVYLIMANASRLVVRRTMFGVGVVLFFLARGISVWHAW